MTPPLTTPPKRSWPLLTLAVSSFIPVFGFVLGAAAVTWGLLSDRPRAKLAVGIGGVGALLQIVGGVLLVWTLEDTPMMRKTQAASTAIDLNRLVVELDSYRERAGRYPSSLQELVGWPIPTRMVNISDLSAGILHPQPYQYHSAADGTTYKLFAVGPDGDPGTSDDIYPTPADSGPTAPTVEQ